MSRRIGTHVRGWRHESRRRPDGLWVRLTVNADGQILAARLYRHPFQRILGLRGLAQPLLATWSSAEYRQATAIGLALRAEDV